MLHSRYIQFTITCTSPLYEPIMHATVSHLTNVNRLVARMHTPELRDEPIDSTCLDFISEVTVLHSRYI